MLWCGGYADVRDANEETMFSEPMSNVYITWDDVNWTKVQSRVRKIQHRIYKASLNGDTKRMYWLQRFLVNSRDAKLLAVRQVTTLNKGKSTPGVDKKVIITAEQRINLALNLELDGYAAPIRRVWIPKPGKTEKRPLGIPTIKDRACQALAKCALEPQWEAVFEPDSYGFRPGRSAHDAIESIFLNLHHNRPKWVYDADIRKCFDRIDHDALLDKLNTYPQMERQIRAWLKAGIMEGYANTLKEDPVDPTILGTPQGGIISPLLANIALHGLEFHLKSYVAELPIKPNPSSGRGRAVKSKALGFVRYADDFVLIHENKEILELCVIETKKWLSQIGLEISEEKSSLRDGRGGFNFLGFQIILVRKLHAGRYKVKITPSKQSRKRFLLKIRDIIQRNKSVSSFDLICILRPRILGWANYYKYCECKEVFHILTHMIFQKIRAWVFRRDTRNGRQFVKEKYFPSDKYYSFYGVQHQDNWILCGKRKFKNGVVKEIFLPHLVWVPSMKHTKVKGMESPFSFSHYWSLRTSKYSTYPHRVRELLVKQTNRCPICKKEFNSFDSTSWEVDHIIPKFAGGLDMYDNLQLLHKECHEQKTKMDLLGYKPKNKKVRKRNRT
jgi:RNA-directed DNA polymerase